MADEDLNDVVNRSSLITIVDHIGFHACPLKYLFAEIATPVGDDQRSLIVDGVAVVLGHLYMSELAVCEGYTRFRGP